MGRNLKYTGYIIARAPEKGAQVDISYRAKKRIVISFRNG